MRLQRGKLAPLVTVWSLLLLCSPVSALDTTEPPTDYYSPVYITAFQTSRTTQQVNTSIVTTDALNIVELHNDTSDPINLSNWSVQASDQYGLICTITLTSWILPDDFVTLASNNSGLGDSTGNIRRFDTCTQPERTISYISLVNEGNVEEQLTPDRSGAFARKSMTKTYRSGVFTKDFEVMDSDSRTSFYAGTWYEPAAEANVQIVEILAHARQCSPTEQAPDCNDFIKFHNPTTRTISLDGLRIRTGYQGQSATTSNTHVLSGTMTSGQYAALLQRSNGDPISLTNSGGWVWLEDAYGTTVYDETVTEYPSASSATKVGWAWALNIDTGKWQWTTSPTPHNVANVFTLPTEKTTTKSSSSLVPCRSDQYRNPLTNRCKLLSSTASSLKPCDANQFRNPATNRCRSLSSSSNSLIPCKSTQYRNPETNRCKSIASTTSTLKPCTKNQERNPETNRCRNKVITPTADYAVKAATSTGQATIGWWAFGGAGALAVGYAGWEWRKEVSGAIRKSVSFLMGNK